MTPKEKSIDFYNFLYAPIGVEPVFEGELFGLSHEEAKKRYFEKLENGDFDDEDCD